MTTYTAIADDEAGTVLATGTLYTVATALSRDSHAKPGRTDGKRLNDDELHALNLVLQAMGSSRREAPSQQAGHSAGRASGPIPVEDL